MAVIVKQKAYKKIEAYARNTGNSEIGGLLLGKKVADGNIIVKDAMLLKQFRIEEHFEIDDEALMELTKNAKPKLLKSIIGWWHSHHNYSTFWSIDDDNCFERLCDLSDFCLGVVVAFKGRNKLDSRWRLDVKDKNNRRISVDNISPEIRSISRYIIKISQIRQELSDKVMEDNRQWKPCPYCRGTGQIEITPRQDTVALCANDNSIIGDTAGDYIG